jgi:predicted lipoprotein with Yx(FWY)xxD motif
MFSMTTFIARRLVLAAGLAGTALVAAGLVAASAASAAPAAASRPATVSHPASKSATVVKERARHHFGKILVTTSGMALYYLPHGSCTGACLTIWPRLAMAAGKTKPKGAACLGTVKFGKHGLQVTYRKHRLYTFIDDMGTSVTGNNVEGFKVAKVTAGRCP